MLVKKSPVESCKLKYFAHKSRLEAEKCIMHENGEYKYTRITVKTMLDRSGAKHGLGAEPQKMLLNLAPPRYILVKNQEVNCAKFLNFDGFCSQNL